MLTGLSLSRYDHSYGLKGLENDFSPYIHLFHNGLKYLRVDLGLFAKKLFNGLKAPEK